MGDIDSMESKNDVDSVPEKVVEDSRADTTKKSKLSEDRLAKLSKARVRAAEVNKQRKEDRLRAKVAALDAPKVKQEPAMDPVVVVEQSDSDPEQLEGPPGVLFVRRSRKKLPTPEKTPEQMHLDKMYRDMFG